MKAVIIYKTGNDVTMDRIMEFYPRHALLVDSFAKDKKVIGIGAFTDVSGSMGIFRDKECAEEFVRQDPFVLEGIVNEVTIKEWNDALL